MDQGSLLSRIDDLRNFDKQFNELEIIGFDGLATFHR